MNIILIEDNDVLRELIEQTLVQDQHQVHAFASAEDFDEANLNQTHDVFLIDVGLPGENGFSLLSRLRNTYSSAIMMLITARTATKDKIQGYDLGADLYLPKPFDVTELRAALRSFTARAQRQDTDSKPCYRLHGQTLQLESPDHQFVPLSASEALVIKKLANARDNFLEHWQLAEILEMDLDSEFTKSNLEVRMARLRKKISPEKDATPVLRAIRGAGYKLCISVLLV